MDETRHTPNPGPDPDAHPDAHLPIGHETSDVNVWAVGRFAIGLVFICLLSLALLLGLFKYFQSQDATSVANTVEPRKIFPQPQLQQTPVVDLRTMRTEEDKMLNSYGWVDPKKGVVRIPIDQAIEILAQRGLRSRPQPPEQGASGVSTPTESGLGPKTPGEANEPAAPPPAAQQKSVVGPDKHRPEQVNTKEVQRK